jgi:hypothetical protein
VHCKKLIPCTSYDASSNNQGQAAIAVLEANGATNLGVEYCGVGAAVGPVAPNW